MKIVSLLTVTILILGFAIESRASGQQTEAADTVRVRGKGVGDTKEAALKNAYCNAVETAVGMFVDAEQMVDNDQLVQDKILTHSNAYIERYEEKKSVKHDGVVEVVIVAWVRRAELTRKLRDVMPAVTLNVSSVSQNLYAQIVSMDKRDASAEELLKDAFDNFDPLAQLMKVSVVNAKSPEVSQSKESDDAKILSYQLKFQIDADKYFKVWVPRMDKILSQITLTPGKPFAFRRVRHLIGIWKDVCQKDDFLYEYAKMPKQDYFAYDKMHFMDATVLNASRLIYGSECESRMGHSIACTMHDQDAAIADLWNKGSRNIRRWGTVPKMKAKSKLYVALIKRTNQSGCSGTIYELSDRSAAIISEWMSKYSGLTRERSLEDRSARSTIYHAAFKDATGDEIASGECRAFNHDMSNVGCVCWGDESSDNRNKPGSTIPYVVYMTPWVGCFAGECSTWVDVEVNVGDIARIATISVSSDASASR